VVCYQVVLNITLHRASAMSLRAFTPIFCLQRDSSYVRYYYKQYTVSPAGSLFTNWLWTSCFLLCCSTNLELSYTYCYQSLTITLLLQASPQTSVTTLPHHNSHHLATIPAPLIYFFLLWCVTKFFILHHITHLWCPCVLLRRSSVYRLTPAT